MQSLGKTYGIPPAVDCYDGLGCPFVDEHVGYFDVEYDLEKINCILSAFALALTAYEIDELDVEYLLNNFESDYRIYLNYTDDIRFGYRMLLGSDYSSVSERFFSKFGDVDNVYVDRVGALTVGFGEDSLKKISDLLKFDLFEVDEIYFGLNYCLVRGGELTVSIDADYIKRINMFLDIMKIEDKNFLKYKISPYSILIKTPYSDFWAIVMALNGTQDIFALNERQYMQEMCKNVPIKYWAKGELEILLRKYRKTAFRYFGI